VFKHGFRVKRYGELFWRTRLSLVSSLNFSLNYIKLRLYVKVNHRLMWQSLRSKCIHTSTAFQYLKTLERSSETFLFIYCIEQRCCYIVISVNSSTPLPTLSYSVDNIGVLSKSAATLGSSVNNIGVVNNIPFALIKIVVIVLLI
jgi:hypothetical protein